MKQLLDMLYPRRCIGCGAASPDSFHYICWFWQTVLQATHQPAEMQD
jgi:hypothetical protein